MAEVVEYDAPGHLVKPLDPARRVPAIEAALALSPHAVPSQEVCRRKRDAFSLTWLKSVC
ncbi:MAG: hypothetical protein HY778_15750 [Betaproteobacteria bacterium]|nr:hypothetical protein [Betaproteobacteria bacterium]